MRTDHKSDEAYRFPLQSTSIRAINRARIIYLVRKKPGLTRTELSHHSGLSKGTITNLVSELIRDGLLYEDNHDEHRKRNTGLWLNRKSGYAVGIELSADVCRAVLTDMGIRALRQLQRPIPSTRVEQAIEMLRGITEELVRPIEGHCVGLAIAVPGPTDTEGRRVIFSESLGWHDVPLADRLSEHFPFPVTLINRPRAGVLGEHWYGAGVGINDLIYVSITTGVAAGILIDGKLFSGAFGNNGELGHTTMLIDGPPCVCGNRGCLESIASLPAIMRTIQGRLQKGEESSLQAITQAGGSLSGQDVIGAARDGDALVVEEIVTAGRYVGIAVANLIDLFNPQSVIIGGRLTEAGDIFLNTVRETAQRRAFPISYSGVDIVRSELGADSVCIGACALIVDNYIGQVEPAWPVGLGSL